MCVCVCVLTHLWSSQYRTVEVTKCHHLEIVKTVIYTSSYHINCTVLHRGREGREGEGGREGRGRGGRGGSEGGRGRLCHHPHVQFYYI